MTTILFCHLEFDSWNAAKRWPYGCNFGLVRALEAAGCDVTVVPLEVLKAVPRQGWRPRFDQVWFELTHSALDEGDLDWISEVAPVRLGYTSESLTYEPADVELVPYLGARFDLVLGRVAAATHVSVVDEADVAPLQRITGKPALWTPFAVPGDFALPPDDPAVQSEVQFSGPLYAKRARWLETAAVGAGVAGAEPPAADVDLAVRFDSLQEQARAAGAAPPLSQEWLREFASALGALRRDAHEAWIRHLHRSPAVVNLPHYVRAWPTRVYEGLAAGRPVITCRIPERPRNASLFVEGEEIVVFGDSPEELNEALERILGEPRAASRIAHAGQRKLLARHTCEIRAAQLLAWLDSEQEPEYSRA